MKDARFRVRRQGNWMAYVALNDAAIKLLGGKRGALRPIEMTREEEIADILRRTEELTKFRNELDKKKVKHHGTKKSFLG